MSTYLSSSQGVAYNGLSQALLLSQNGLTSASSGLSQVINGIPIPHNVLSHSCQPTSSMLTENSTTPSTKVEQSNLSAADGPSSNVLKTDVKKTVVEEVTQVNSKCLAKAMKPPVTIKNFFKPSGKTKNLCLENSEKTDVVVSPDLRITETLARLKPDNETKTTTKKVSYNEFLMGKKSVDLHESNINSPDVVDKNGRSGNDVGDGINVDLEDNDTSVSVSAKSDSNDRLSSYFKNGSSKKRGLEDRTNSQPSKRPKQATLFSTFKKMANKKEEKNSKSVTCPICCKVYENGISNLDLNSHIDNCIIE